MADTSEYATDALVSPDWLEEHLDEFGDDDPEYRLVEADIEYEDVRNYDGSWTEWGNLIRSPVEVETDEPATLATEG